jgi:uncharacterized LabA/DUF88 family protein
MSHSRGTAALFIDGANLHLTARALGFDVDYQKLLAEFRARTTVLRAFYYNTTVNNQEYSGVRALLDWLAYNGFTVVSKPIKESRNLQTRVAAERPKVTWASNSRTVRCNYRSI